MILWSTTMNIFIILVHTISNSNEFKNMNGCQWYDNYDLVSQNEWHNWYPCTAFLTQKFSKQFPTRCQQGPL